MVRTDGLLSAAVPAPGAAIDLEGWRPAPVNAWTDGNVCGSVPAGQRYRELDNVPHRVLFDGLTAGTEYYFGVNIEFLDGTIQGYDNLTDVVGYAGVTSASSAPRPNVTCSGKTCRQFRITFTPSAPDGEIGSTSTSRSAPIAGAVRTSARSSRALAARRSRSR